MCQKEEKCSEITECFIKDYRNCSAPGLMVCQTQKPVHVYMITPHWNQNDLLLNVLNRLPFVNGDKWVISVIFEIALSLIDHIFLLFCPRRTKFVRGLWNGLRTCVCQSVRPCIKICFFSVISWPILILFVLSDRAWWGLQNFYTEFWNSLIMQIYSKSMKNATSPLFLGRFRFCLFYLIGLGGGFKTSTQNLEIH